MPQPLSKQMVTSSPPPSAYSISLEAAASSQASLRSNIQKSMKVFFAASLIGVLDALQARYFPIASLGKEASIFYQGTFMIVSAAAALLSLHDKRWSVRRNALSMLMTVPVSTIADNISLDVQTLKPYILILPENGFAWRGNVFSHTFLFPIASCVDHQTIAPGLIDGYVAAIGIAVAYLTLQFFWSRILTNSKRLVLKNHLQADRKILDP